MTKIWLDTINIETIHDASKKGLCYGVTTNPAILSQSTDVKQTLKSVLAFQEGPVAVQVTANQVSQMLEEGKKIHDFSSRFVVKVPVNENGLVVINELIKQKVPVMATGILTPEQAFLAINARATYMAPYYAHMGREAFAKVAALPKEETKMVVASVREVKQVMELAALGVDFITIKDEVYKQFVANYDPSEALTSKFCNQWHEKHPSIGKILDA